MKTYVVEIGGKPVLAIVAASPEEAQEVMDDEGFRDDLETFESDGMPLWDGEAELALREASTDEHATTTAARARAVEDGEIENDDIPFVVFLVPVTDLTEDDEADNDN